MGVLWENTLLGGNTWVGWSPTCTGGGTGSFTVSMPNALLITKAYLIAGRCGVPVSGMTVSLYNGFNTQSLTFSNATRVSQEFITSYQSNAGLSSVHAIDVTSIISPLATNYTLTIPQQLFFGSPSPSVRYTDFALAIEYFTGTGKTTTQWYINENNIGVNNSRVLNFVDPINNALPAGMGLFTGYCCNNIITGNGQHDPSNVLVNATLLGRVGSTTGDGSCGGAGFINPHGNYRYANNVLTAGANCNTNQAVSGLDALSRIDALVALNATTYTLQFNSYEAGNTTNNLWGVATSYVNTTPTYEDARFSTSAPTVGSVTTTTATINWSAQGAIVSFDNRVQWRLWQTTVWTQSGVLSNVSTYTITGLTTNTVYEYRILPVDWDGTTSVQPSAIQRFKTA